MYSACSLALGKACHSWNGSCRREGRGGRGGREGKAGLLNKGERYKLSSTEYYLHTSREARLWQASLLQHPNNGKSTTARRHQCGLH